jgi:PAS domain-containing protein
VPDSQDLFAAELPKSRLLRPIPVSERLLMDSALSIAMIEHADDAVIAKILEGTVLTCNGGAERAFGYCAAEIFRWPAKLFPPDRSHEEDELVARPDLGWVFVREPGISHIRVVT